MWKTGNMHIIRSEIHKERFVLMLLDKLNGMCSNGISYIFIFPQCFPPPFHITNPADTVYNGHIMSVAWFEIVQQFGVVFTGRLTGEIFYIAHFYRSGRIVIGNLAIFNKYTRNPVGRGSHNIRVIES